MDKSYLKKLVDFKGNRYVLTKACNEYAKKVRYLSPDDYEKVKSKDSLLALSHMLEEEVSYTLEKPQFEEDDLTRESILFDPKFSPESDNKEKSEEAEMSENPENP